MKFKLNFKVIIIVLFSALLLSLIYNGFSADGIPLIRQPLKVSLINDISSENNVDGLKGLQLSDVVNLHENEDIIFIDARDQWDYSEGHISRAINIPEFSFDPNNDQIRHISKDKMMIVYCDGNECDTSKRLASELTKLGYKNVFIYLGGYSEWEQLELPIERINSDE